MATVSDEVHRRDTPLRQLLVPLQPHNAATRLNSPAPATHSRCATRSPVKPPPGAGTAAPTATAPLDRCRRFAGANRRTWMLPHDVRGDAARVEVTVRLSERVSVRAQSSAVLIDRRR